MEMSLGTRRYSETHVPLSRDSSISTYGLCVLDSPMMTVSRTAMVVYYAVVHIFDYFSHFKLIFQQ